MTYHVIKSAFMDSLFEKHAKSMAGFLRSRFFVLPIAIFSIVSYAPAAHAAETQALGGTSTLGAAVASMPHAAIHADVAFAYGIANGAPEIARAVTTSVGALGDSLIIAAAHAPQLAASLYMGLASAPAVIAPALAQTVFSKEYALASQFVGFVHGVSRQYLGLVSATGEIVSGGASALGSFPAQPAALLGTPQVAIVSNTSPTVLPFATSTVSLAAAAAAEPLPSSPVANPAPVIAPPERVTNVSYPTYTTVMNGVSADYLSQSLAALRTSILATVAGMVQPVAVQTATNATTIQQVNMIQNLSDLTVNNGTFEGGTFDKGNITNGIAISATNGTFTSLTGGTSSLATTTITGSLSTSGNVTIAGVLTAGSLSVAGVSSGNAVSAPYFTATSTTATSTFSGSLSVDNGGFTYATSTRDVGIGTVSPSSRLDITNSATSSPILVLRDPLGNDSLELRAGTSTLQNTYIGYQAGQANTQGYSNVALGYQSLYSNTGYTAADFGNTAIGYQSLYSNNGTSVFTGYENTAIGYQAGYNVTTGNNNTAIGGQALFQNSTGSQNIAIGSALYSNTTGSSNIALGYLAGYNNTTGNNNTAIGYLAGYNITTGYDNIFLGHDANTGGTAITTGYNDIGLGYNIKFPSSASSNMLNIGNFLFANLPATTTLTTLTTQPLTGRLGVGTSSPYAKLTVWGGDTLSTSKAFEIANSASTTLLSVFDNGNLGIGTTSPSSRLDITNSATSSPILVLRDPLGNDSLELRAGTSTLQNTFVGRGAGLVNTTGSYNAALGMNSFYSNTTGSYNTAVGMDALYFNTTGNNNTVVGMNAALFSTGNNNSAFGQNTLWNNVGDANTAIGNTALYNNSTGASSTALGYNAGYSNTTGSYNTFLGYNAGYGDGVSTTTATLTNATAIGYNAQVTASNALILGGTGAYGVNVGIGTTSPYAKLSVVGQVLADSFNATSSVGYQLAGTTLLTASSTSRNTFLGLGVGTSTTSGTANTFLGYNAG